MKTTIDLLGNKEKTKVSLALSQNSVNLLDKAILGFRSLYLLMAKSGDIYGELNTKNSQLFKNSLTRSDMVDQIISGISEENIFSLGNKLYSLKGFSEIFDEVCIDLSLLRRINLAEYVVCSYEYQPIDEDDERPGFQHVADVISLSEKDAMTKYSEMFRNMSFDLGNNIDSRLDPEDFEFGASPFTFEEIRDNYSQLSNQNTRFDEIRMDRFKSIFRECLKMECESLKFKYQLYMLLKSDFYEDDFELSEYFLVQRYYQLKYGRKGAKIGETENLSD